LLFGITSRLGFTDDNVVESVESKPAKPDPNGATQKGASI